MLREAQTSGIKEGVSGEECFERNSCGWILHMFVCGGGTISPSAALSLVQKAYRVVSEWEFRARESGKLPLALSQHGDFPLLLPHVSV